MSARYRPILTTLAVLAFLVACGFVMQRRASIDDRRRAARMQHFFNRDLQSRKTEAILVAAYQGNLEMVRRFLPDVNQGVSEVS